MDHRELKRLVRLMNDNGLVELEVEQGGVRVSLKKASAPPWGAPGTAWPGGWSPAAAPAPSGRDADQAAAPGGSPELAGTRTVLSPMVGTFYRRSGPDAEPYVDVGMVVEPETVVCIVEAMKVNNEIKAEVRGMIVQILVEDGQPVEFEQPLFRVKVS